MDLNLQLKNLYAQQLRVWDVARKNADDLQKIKTRTLRFNCAVINAQFNPARMVSSGAKVDAGSIQNRKCFLCKENRPEFQDGIVYKDAYEILINPFPILPFHFTIPRIEHVPQQILPYFGDMLSLAQELTAFTILYNGPASGASAPDHMHFQAVEKNHLPVECEYEKLKENSVPLYKSDSGICYVLQSYLRSCVVIESVCKNTCVELFTQLYNSLPQNDNAEPMMNVFCQYKDETWVCFVFPRKQHRPWQYFAEGNAQMIISPGAIDMGGILIIPREQDFLNLNENIISDIYNQVSMKM